MFILAILCQDLPWLPLDLFILLAKARLVADWQAKNQQHARKFASFFWVFKKCDKRIIYGGLKNALEQV